MQSAFFSSFIWPPHQHRTAARSPHCHCKQFACHMIMPLPRPVKIHEITAIGRKKIKEYCSHSFLAYADYFPLLRGGSGGVVSLSLCTHTHTFVPQHKSFINFIHYFPFDCMALAMAGASCSVNVQPTCVSCILFGRTVHAEHGAHSTHQRTICYC